MPYLKNHTHYENRAWQIFLKIVNLILFSYFCYVDWHVTFEQSLRWIVLQSAKTD